MVCGLSKSTTFWVTCGSTKATLVLPKTGFSIPGSNNSGSDKAMGNHAVVQTLKNEVVREKTCTLCYKIRDNKTYIFISEFFWCLIKVFSQVKQ